MIADLTKGEMLILNPSRLTATKLKAASPVTAIPNLVQEMKNLPDQADRKLGTKDIDGRQAEGFLIHKQGQDFLLWADNETGLPVCMEGEVVDRKGHKGKWTVTDMKFNVELDESLFSLELPPGYTMDESAMMKLERSRQMANRAMSAANMNKLAVACIRYAKDHNGKWPDSLQQLGQYGISEEQLINPLNPELKVGYIYIRPADKLADFDQLLIHERYEVWKDGINVAFANGPVQFISNEAEFKRLLKNVGAE